LDSFAFHPSPLPVQYNTIPPFSPFFFCFLLN
jgi:hypothetical protein